MSKRLGRGLAELLETSAVPTSSHFVMLKTDQIRLGRFQPRRAIREEALEELKASIKKSGVIEPVIVRPLAHGTYELVAGERRWRASQAIGIQDVPAIIKTLSDKEALEFSLIENIQRENLNPVEESRGYKRLLDEFGYTQETIAEAVGKSRATIANMLRLLTLSEEILNALEAEAITMGHAKALLSIDDGKERLELFRRIATQAVSVRQLETIAQSSSAAKRRRVRRIDPQMKAVEDQLRQLLGTKVVVSLRKKGGRILIEYFSQDDLNRILQVLGISG